MTSRQAGRQAGRQADMRVLGAPKVLAVDSALSTDGSARAVANSELLIHAVIVSYRVMFWIDLAWLGRGWDVVWRCPRLDEERD